METLLEDIDVYGLLDNILGEDFRTHIDGLKELGADYFKCKNVKYNITINSAHIYNNDRESHKSKK